MKAAESASLIGFVLDERYAIVREIGRGGMGVVYEAEHTELGKRIAVKVLLDKYADDDEAVVRFKREALAASRIGSPHIIDVSHIGSAPDGRPYVVMELLEGESLAALLRRSGPMEPARALHVIRQVLRATGAAHAKGIVHRDLKPDNIFIVDRDDQHDFVKLLDFGISKFLETGEFSLKTQLTTTGAVMGTPLYMAPEQAMGAPIAPSVDIYACGVMLYEMLAGRPPFVDGNYNMIVAQLLTAKPPRLDELRKKLPKQLVAAVHHALEKEPAARFATADAFAAALPRERGESQLDLLATQPQPAAVRPPRRVLPWIAGASVVVAGAVIAIAALHRTAPTPPSTPTPTLTAIPAGTLEVRTIPTGATVTLDGRDGGVTPIEMTVTPGRHRLHVALAGYVGVDADQDVGDHERTSATLTLVPAPEPVVPVPVPVAVPKIVKRPAAGSASPKPQNPYDASPPPTPTDTLAKPNPYGN